MFAYLLSVAAIWLACLALYALVLQREKFLLLNRYFLLATLLAGLLIPALGPWLAPLAPLGGVGQWAQLAYTLPTLTIGAPGESVATHWGWASILSGVYGAGCLWAGLRFLVHLGRIRRLVKGGNCQQLDGLVWVEHAQIKAPFSFGRYLFWPTQPDYTAAEAQAIEVHERAHIRQWHSADLLALEMLGIFFWWCPLWYVYGRYLREVHEYLADAAALRHTSTRVYGQLLIRQCLLGQTPQFAHGLNNHSQLKNRIAMMTKSNSSRLALAKYLLVCPVLALSIVACSSQNDLTGATEPLSDVFKPVRQVIDTVITFDPETFKESMAVFAYDIYQEAEEMPVFGACAGKTGEELSACSSTNLLTYIAAQMKYPEAARVAKTEGMVVASFIVSASGQVKAVSIKRSLSPDCDAEVMRILNEMPNWQPGKVSGKAVDVEMTMPIRFKL